MYKRGLRHRDNDVDKYMEEASLSQMAPEIRMLFATLFYYCKPSKPNDIFSKFYSCMANDFAKHKVKLVLTDSDIMHRVLLGINGTLKYLGKEVGDYNIESFSLVSTRTEQLTRAAYLFFRKISMQYTNSIRNSDMHSILFSIRP
ncbi:hypothetical protein LIER_41489 [Lithospermum erythrorhizon]|uniref:Uncharacterized protein n=1 Tax=Lithospermum erythrorhizon TaxID=34254 RepID=A0AAV3RE89_LITER